MGKKSRKKREKRKVGKRKPQAELMQRYLRDEKRVAICGIGVGYEMAPEHGEVWCMNDLGTLRYCTMLWDMHDFEWTDEQSWNQLKLLHKEALSDDEIRDRLVARKDRFRRIADFCNTSGLPLMSIRKYDGSGPTGLSIGTSVGFPLKAVVERTGTDFMNCSMAFAFAFAIMQRYTHVDLFGINVETGTEWVYQRDCVSYWIGRMTGHGIKVTVNGSRWKPLVILDGIVYGFQLPQDFSKTRLFIVKNVHRKELRHVYTEAPEHAMSMKFVEKEEVLE